MVLQKYASLGIVYLRRNFIGQLGLSILLLLLIPPLFGISNLDAAAAAAPLELMAALIGIILLPSIFQPESKPEISEVVESKYTNHILVCLMRYLITIAITFLLLAILILAMQSNRSDVSLSYLFGTFAEAFFLGALGALAFSISNNVAVAYMIPMIYYILCYAGGAQYFGNFYLFSMMSGSFTEKIWLFGTAIILSAAAFGFRLLRKYLS